MLGRYQRRIAKYFAANNKDLFLKNIKELIDSVPGNAINLDVVSFSGSNYLTDQLYSLLSFLYNVGTPTSWTIYNDGTYTASEKELLMSIPSVRVVDFDMSSIDEDFREACKKFPTLKKMFIFRDIEPVRPTILTDSDILFYKPFKTNIEKFSKHNWYIVDEGALYFDEDYLQKNGGIEHPLNLGFLVINSKPDWEIAFDYLRKKIKSKQIHYWTDQTATHIMATSSADFYPMDKYLFVINGSDSFRISHHQNYNKIAVRHFVGPIRHKMWQYSWKKILTHHS